MRPYHVRQARELFKRTLTADDEFAAVEVDGDALQVCSSDDCETLIIAAPFNEKEDLIAITVTNAVLKRWIGEAKWMKATMRRAASGEKKTKYQEQHGRMTASVANR